MNMPLVSVILPVRNGERFLQKSIESVLSQNYEPVELIVVDGHSSDRSEEIACSYPGVKLVPQKGLGIPGAMNQGVRLAQGPLIAFLSSDDFWTADKLARQVQLLIERPETMYSIANFRYFVEPGCLLPRGFNPNLLNRDLTGLIMETLVVRREAFDIVGWFDTSHETAADVDWYARAKDAGIPMSTDPRVLLHKRIHDKNATSDARNVTPLLFRVLRASLTRKQAG